MNRTTGWMCIAALLLCIPAVANAQIDQTGGEETPGAPSTVGAETTSTTIAPEDKIAKKVDTRYPIELIYRPLTLPAAMSQVGFDYPVNIDPFSASLVLSAQYGITSKIQLGLRYGAGSLTEDGFTEGKTVAVDAMYSLHKLVAIQVSVPLLLDPVATGVVIGAPFRFQFGKLALFGGHDFLSVKFKRFVPSVGDPLSDEANVALDKIGGILPDGAIKVLFGVNYQHTRKLVLSGELGFIAQDFAATDGGVPLMFTAMHSFSRKLDLGGRVGFGNLDNANNTFGLAVFVAFRI